MAGCAFRSNLPGRTLQLRVWQATVGRVKLYLLDSNDALNNPPDRGITSKLYGGGSEVRLMQEIVLGVGGWRVVEALHPEVEICHVNEGHAAFAMIERARHLSLKHNLDFWEALWATRAGNVFTTHTPVAAGFDRFPADLLRKYLPYVKGVLAGSPRQTRRHIGAWPRRSRTIPTNRSTWRFWRSAVRRFRVGVSRLHGEVSRHIFQPLFPRWPSCEVPISHITNGVHIPTWDSAAADRVWTKSYGKERWRSPPSDNGERLGGVTDAELWAMRGEGRRRVVHIARAHLSRQLRERGLESDDAESAETALDPNILTLGFARRFTEYKRPNLLLSDRERLGKLLLDSNRPVQIVVAGKAHSADYVGKEMIQEWINFGREPKLPPACRVPGGLRNLPGAGIGPRRGRLDQHAAQTVGSVRHQRNESAGQWRAQLLDARRLVGRGLYRECRLVDRRR